LEQRVKDLEKEILDQRKVTRDLGIFKTAVESSINAIGITDLEGKMIYVNDSCVKMWGYNSKDEILGRFLPEFWEGNGIKNTIKKLRETGKASGEDVGKRKNGSLFFVQFMASMFKDEAGNPSFMFGSFFDITKRHKSEESLRDSEEQLRSLLQNIQTAVVVHGPDTKIIKCNKASQELLGLTEDQMLGQKSSAPIWMLFDEAGRNLPLEQFPVNQVISSKNVLNNFIAGIYRPNKNDVVNVLVNAVPKTDHNGNISQVIVTFVDITDLKRVEQTLHFMQFAIDRSSDAAFWMGPDANLIYVNEAASRTLGYSREELLKKTIHDIDPDFSKEVWPEHWKNIKQQRSFVLESHHQTKDGRIFPVEISVNYLEFKGKEYNCAFARDISQRKKKEEIIQLSRREWESTFDAMSDWVSLIDLKGRILRSNCAGENILGAPTEKIIGRMCCDLVHGTKKPIPECPMQKMLQTHKRETTDLYVKEISSWLRISVDPVMDEDKNLIKVVHIVRDITELKKIEEERLKVMKLESIGIMAGGIAHDYNNLLSVILGNIELAKEDIDPDMGISTFLAEAEKASLKSKELTKQLITFSKGGEPVKGIDSAGNLVQNIINQTIFDTEIKCEVHLSENLWLTEFDEDQMKLALKNILNNSAEAMPKGGSIDINLENFEICIENMEPDLSLSMGKYVKISIRDQGAGISRNHLHLIFDPYFSTKDMGVQKGMGLGLATVYSIIRRHDGHITVESEVGVGTVFTLYLPAYEKDKIELKPFERPTVDKELVSTGKILVMDDEEMIRCLAKQRLIRFGYDADIAKDGAEAFELYKRALDSGKPYDAVILDLTVKKGMGGKEAVKKVLEIDPQAKAIVSSGYSTDPVLADFKRYGFIGALTKPYTMRDLGLVLGKIKEINKK